MSECCAFAFVCNCNSPRGRRRCEIDESMGQTEMTSKKKKKKKRKLSVLSNNLIDYCFFLFSHFFLIEALEPNFLLAHGGHCLHSVVVVVISGSSFILQALGPAAATLKSLSRLLLLLLLMKAEELPGGGNGRAGCRGGRKSLAPSDVRRRRGRPASKSSP